MTAKEVVQSWTREQLESAFTQREVQLEEAMKENAELRQQLAAFHAAMEREKKPDWQKWWRISWTKPTDTTPSSPHKRTPSDT